MAASQKGKLMLCITSSVPSGGPTVQPILSTVLLVPVVGLASAAVLLGETLTGMQLAGAVLIMAGLYINVFGFRVRRTARVSG